MRCVILLSVILIAILVWLCAKKSSGLENMAYLDQYETQDNYRNVPESWPVIYTSTTALYAAKRQYLNELLGRA
jgi:hypothetical protein